MATAPQPGSVAFARIRRIMQSNSDMSPLLKSTEHRLIGDLWSGELHHLHYAVSIQMSDGRERPWCWPLPVGARAKPGSGERLVCGWDNAYFDDRIR